MNASPAHARLPRLGFVGVGWIGAHRLQKVAESGCAEIVAIADVRDAIAREAARSVFEAAAQGAAPTAAQAAAHAAAQGATRGARPPDAGRTRTSTSPVPSICSFDALLDNDLDGIVIATPNADHAPQALAALDRGISVFCQKPLARTRAEVSQILDRAREKNCLLDVDFCYRHVAGVPELKALIADGSIGQVFAADLTFHNAYGPDKPWFFDARSVGGGCVMDLGLHLVDLLLWVLEYPALEATSSRLYRNGQLLRRPIDELENYALADLRFANGLTARLACSWHLPAGQDAVIEATFYGTHGALRLRNVEGSFYDFVVERCEGTRSRALSKPSREWGGVAICNWARQLAVDSRFDPRAEHIESVHHVLDEIYGRCES